MFFSFPLFRIKSQDLNMGAVSGRAVSDQKCQEEIYLLGERIQQWVDARLLALGREEHINRALGLTGCDLGTLGNIRLCTPAEANVRKFPMPCSLHFAVTHIRGLQNVQSLDRFASQAAGDVQETGIVVKRGQGSSTWLLTTTFVVLDDLECQISVKPGADCSEASRRRVMKLLQCDRKDSTLVLSNVKRNKHARIQVTFQVETSAGCVEKDMKLSNVSLDLPAVSFRHCTGIVTRLPGAVSGAIRNQVRSLLQGMMTTQVAAAINNLFRESTGDWKRTFDERMQPKAGDVDDRKQIARAIVDQVRAQVQETESKDAPDKWNEQQEGVNWLNNEVGLFDRLLLRVDRNMGWTIEEVDWTDVHTVGEAEYALAQRSPRYLRLLRNFIAKGGSSNPASFKFVRADAATIMDYLDTPPVYRAS